MIRRETLYRQLLISLGSCLLVCLMSCSQKPKTLFTSLSPAETGVKFSNRIYESDSINILENEYVYNGGGVGIGDFNNDQLPDLYFTGNMTSNRLYLNRGQMKFEDVTSLSKVEGQNKWCSGVAVVDINTDGLDDIYVCATFNKDSISRQNILYVNQGNDKDGIPQFREMAEQYGIGSVYISQ
jgi:enediyne biosynthesis protein E4